MIAGVIMAGGRGERFWPRSRVKSPKQFISLTGDHTMIQDTVNRIIGLVNSEDIYIATGNEYLSLIQKQLPEVPINNIISEPMGKNTAACIGLAAISIARVDKNAVMVVLPSDHLVKNKENFLYTIKKAVSIAEMGENLVTIGITPTHPETGYGYINFDDSVNHQYGDLVYRVERFVEKPDKHTAQKYLDSGKYLWNSGMFVWKVSTILNSIKVHMPELYQALSAIDKAWGTESYEDVLVKEYSRLESISIDYGIMEHADNIYVLPGIFGWDDVGSWTSLERIHDTDDEGNIISGNIVQVDTKKCIIQGNEKLIATIGLEDLIIVDTKDATLICSKDRAQQVKDILNKLKMQKSEKYL